MKRNLENQSFVRSFLKFSNEPLLAVEGNIINACNDAAERFLGTQKDELVGRRIWDILDFEMPQEVRGKSFLSELAKSKYNTHPARVRRNEGTSMPCDIEFSVSSLETEDFFIMNLNVGTHNNQQSKPNHETSLHDSLVARFTLSKRGIIHSVNTSAVELVGYKQDNLLKRRFDSLIKKSGDNAYSITSQLIGEILQGKKIQDIEVELVNSDGEPVWVSLTAQYFDSKDAPLIELLAVDITATKAAEESKKIAQEQVALWTEVMTHDLNNVNQSILFSIGFVLETVTLPEEARMKLQEANWEIRRGARMISNLRKLNQFRNHSPSQKAIDLASCIRGAVSVIEDQITHKDVQISFEGNIEGVKVLGNENLEDVFFNVIENSIVHDSSAKANITIKVTNQDLRNRVRIEIEDRGPGIPDNLKPFVFDRMGFLQGHEGGRGLGLTLVHTIIQSIRGDIWVEDRVDGKSSLGTRVVIELELWREEKALKCGRDSCIAFYTSNHCLFCGPSLDILIGVLEQFGINSSVIEIINIDNPSIHLGRTNLPMLPVTRICDREITGLANVTIIRQAVSALMLQQCARLTWLGKTRE